MADTFYLQNRIQLEVNNLQRNHVYYSVDEQPEVCARLIAQGLRGCKSSGNIMDDIADGWSQLNQAISEKLKPAVDEFIHHVSVAVQSWDDVPAAIGLIRERQREFKRGMR